MAKQYIRLKKIKTILLINNEIDVEVLKLKFSSNNMQFRIFPPSNGKTGNKFTTHKNKFI